MSSKIIAGIWVQGHWESHYGPRAADFDNTFLVYNSSKEEKKK